MNLDLVVFEFDSRERTAWVQHCERVPCIAWSLLVPCRRDWHDAEFRIGLTAQHLSGHEFRSHKTLDKDIEK
jgi:hypothetical protein